MSFTPPLRFRLASRGSSRGTGLAELTVALALLALFLSLGIRGGGALRDRWAALGAGDALTQLIREARARAVARGGATVIVSAADTTARLESTGLSLRSLPLGREFGVWLDLGSADEVQLVFDAAGVGRMASRTIQIHRGDAQRDLVVSTYGRVR